MKFPYSKSSVVTLTAGGVTVVMLLLQTKRLLPKVSKKSVTSLTNALPVILLITFPAVAPALKLLGELRVNLLLQSPAGITTGTLKSMARMT